MIRYLIGRSGCGKTHWIYQEIQKILQNTEDRKIILLVPELFTFQAEKELINDMQETREKMGTLAAEKELIGFLETDGLLRAEVLSFNSLTRRVFEDTGEARQVMMNGLGKTLLLKKLLLEEKDDLKLYGKASHKMGMIERLSDTLDALQREGLAPEVMRDLSGAAKVPDMLKEKLGDLALLQEELSVYLKEHDYLDAGMRQACLLEAIGKCAFLKDASIFIDGFSGFTTPNLQIIAKLLHVAKDVTISLTMDRTDAADADLFMPIRSSFYKLQKVAEEEGVRVAPPEFPDFADTARPAALLHMEKNAFADEPQTYPEKTDALKTVERESAHEEILAAGKELLKWAAEGVRWNEMALAVFNLNEYAPQIERTFRSMGIPCFISIKRGILHQPLVQFLLSTLASVRRGFKQEDVFAAFKTGLSLFTTEECDALENYALEWGIEGKARWERSFIEGKIFASDAEKAETEGMEALRLKFTAYMDAVYPALAQAKTCGEMTEALYACVLAAGARTRLTEAIEDLIAQKKTAEASEIQQSWKYMTEIFDQTMKILGDEPITLFQYSQMLASGFEAVEVGTLPATQDQVMIGDMQQALFPAVKRLWVMNFKDGVLPAVNEDTGVLLLAEKDILRDLGREIEMDSEARIMQEYYHVYQALSPVKEKIVFSYALAGTDGGGVRPAVFVEQLKNIFPEMAFSGVMDPQERSYGSAVTFPEMLAEVMKVRDGENADAAWPGLYTWYHENPDWQEKTEIAKRALFHRNQPGKLTAEQAHKLYGREKGLNTSISRLQEYAHCPFSQLIKNGFTPKERKEFVMETRDTGNYIHELMERYFKLMQAANADWEGLTQEEVTTTLREILKEIPEDYNHGFFTANSGNKYLKTRLDRLFELTGWFVTEQVTRGKFRPWSLEMDFGNGKDAVMKGLRVPMDNGETITLRGKIDRLDVYMEGDTAWLRVIDYKTGNTDFSLKDIYYGVSIQLVLYMLTVLENLELPEAEQKKFAGMFLLHLQEKWLKADANKDPEEEMLKEYKLDGLMLRDLDLGNKMDENLVVGSTSSVTGASIIKKTQDFGANSPVITEEELNIIFRYVRQFLKKSGEAILDGQCRIYPTLDNGKSPCMYCKYRAICQFDRKLPDNDYHKLNQLNKMKDTEIIARMEEELTAEGVMPDGE